MRCTGTRWMLFAVSLTVATLLLNSCGDGSSDTANRQYTVGGTIVGLKGSVVLQNRTADNRSDNLTVTSNGSFTFSGKLINGTEYAVSVFAQPTGQTCSVKNGAGKVSGSNAMNAAVICSTAAYPVSGAISGLAGTVVLQNNHSDDLTLSTNGAFTFASPVAEGSGYAVTVLTQPPGQTCSVAHGTGTIAEAAIADVAVTCVLVGSTDGSAPNDAPAVTIDGNVPQKTDVVALSVRTDSLAAGTVGTSYTATLLATGGTGSYSWSIVSGALPSGLTMASSTGTISGAPTGAGNASFTVRVTDASTATSTKALSIAVAAASEIIVAVTPSTISLGTGQSHTFTAKVTGTTNYKVTWSVQGGTNAGTIDANTGTYHAPHQAGGPFAILATSAGDSSKQGTAQVYVTAQQARIPRMALISRGAPAYASAGTAANGNSSNYENAWEASSTDWLAYDLSTVPVAQRSAVMVSWTIPNLQRYDSAWDSSPRAPHAENGVVPGPYVIEGSANSTNGGNGTWMTLFEDKSPQQWKSRTHLLNLGGYTWIRYRGTGNNPTFSSASTRTLLHLDVHDASASIEDSWVMFGDSITGAAWRWSDFPVRVEKQLAGHFPLVQPGGIAFMSASMVLADWWEWNNGDVVTHAGTSWFDHWLSLFPGKHVVMAYGTNDTNGNFNAADFRANYKLLIDKTIAAGKIPVIPSVIWNSTNDTYIRRANDILGVRPGAPPAGSLKATYGKAILSGPDLYGTFYGKTSWIEENGAGLHPTGELADIGSGTTNGYGVYRQAWADWATTNLY